MRQTFKKKKKKVAIITEFSTTEAVTKIMVLLEDSTAVVEFSRTYCSQMTVTSALACFRTRPVTGLTIV